MEKLFTTDTKYLNSDIGLLIGRIALALLMLSHGLPKLQLLFSNGPVEFPAVLGLSSEVSLTLTVFAEVFCSFLILVGLGTRLATIPLIMTMLVAVFSIHAADVFAKKELAVLYLAGYLILLFGGSGKYSFDKLLQSKPRKNYQRPVRRIEDPTISIYH